MHHLIVLGICGIVLLGSFVFDAGPDGVYVAGVRLPFHRCALREYTGLRCTLCGMSRSFCSLAAGRPSESVGFHWLGPVLFTFVCAQIPYRIAAVAIRPKALPRGLVRANTCGAIVVTVALLLNWCIYLGGVVL